MKLLRLPKMLSVLRQEVKQWKQPIVGTFAAGPNALFKVLISTLLSLRTQDKTTEEASHRLFAVAETPQALLDLSEKEIEKLIYPVGFYRTKARTLRKVCRLLLERHGGEVPGTLEELLALPGVGRKTANLVVTVGFKKPGICVDTHVHRISNRWGLVKTKTPDETEMALRKTLPKRYWIEINDLLVCFGQNLCQPVSPRCTLCKIRKYCPRIGVVRSR
jgi:endonuclease III